MVTRDEFGSLVAEHEGFRDTILDEIASVREDIENLKEDLKEIKKLVASVVDNNDNARLLLR
jgi:archaellum component FlaC